MAESESTSQRHSDLDPTSSSSLRGPARFVKKPAGHHIQIRYGLTVRTCSVSYSGTGPPGAYDFKKFLSHARHGKGDGEVEELNVDDFDQRGDYKEIIQRVERAEKGEKGVQVFRAQVSSTKVEYYILTIGNRNLIGVVTKAVES